MTTNNKEDTQSGNNSGVATVYGARGEFRRLPPPSPVKTRGPPPVRKNIFYGLAVEHQEYRFAKLGLYISFNKCFSH